MKGLNLSALAQYTIDSSNDVLNSAKSWMRTEKMLAQEDLKLYFKQSSELFQFNLIEIKESQQEF